MSSFQTQVFTKRQILIKENTKTLFLIFNSFQSQLCEESNCLVKVKSLACQLAFHTWE